MFSVILQKARETKRTVRYENDSDNSPVSVLYVRKTGLPTPFPDSITIAATVTS